MGSKPTTGASTAAPAAPAPTGVVLSTSSAAPRKTTVTKVTSVAPPAVDPPAADTAVTNGEIGAPHKWTLDALDAFAAAPGDPLPLSELDAAVDAVFEHAKEQQLIDAGVLLRRVQVTIEASDGTSAATRASASLAAHAARTGHSVAHLQERYDQSVAALRMLSGGSSSGWTRAFEVANIVTSTRELAVEEPGGVTYKQMWFKSEGEVDGVELQDLLALWREAKLLRHWVPLCYASDELLEVGRAELLLWAAVRGLPPVDFLLHGYGVDLLPSGYFLMVGASPEQSDWPATPFPKKVGLRLHLTSLAILVEPLSPNAVRTILVASVDTRRTSLPAFLVNLVVKYLLGLLFYQQGKAAKKMRTKPDGNPHVLAQQTRTYFYRDWLIPKVLATIEALRGKSES